MYSAKLKKGAIDVNGKSLEKYVGIEFNCYTYKDYVVIRNHLTTQTHQIEYKYVEIKMP